MSRVAFRRDTEDPDVIRQFAELFDSEEHLKMLYMVGPREYASGLVLT
jgi:UTP:GlnB (protein PII) uridylyltransferase